MPRKATEIEESLFDGETQLSREVMADALPLIQVRAVYLGGNKHKTVRLKGHIVIETVLDPDDPGLKYEVKKQSMEGFTTYDFSTVNSSGKTDRALRALMTTNGRKFQMIEHLGHIVALFQMRGEDKQPMFEILGPKEHIRVVKQYMDETKKRVNPDSGLAVLQDMGL